MPWINWQPKPERVNSPLKWTDPDTDALRVTLRGPAFLPDGHPALSTPVGWAEPIEEDDEPSATELAAASEPDAPKPRSRRRK